MLDAAIDCLVEYGYAKTTMRRIAERAGVTPGALQHHFASKAALLGELIGYMRAKIVTEMFAEGVPALALSVSVKNSFSTACGASIEGRCSQRSSSLGSGLARTRRCWRASPGHTTK